jgi:hypothetical protein
MLAEYPDFLIDVLAELRNAFLDDASREQRIELLAAQLTDPTNVQMAYQDAVDYSVEAEAAVSLLLREHGELPEAQFSRQFGAIRQMGPAKLEREAPWLNPESVAELLYYNGLLGRTFKGAGQQAHTVVYLPSDITAWLPHPQNPAAEGGLPIKVVAHPPAARQTLADDSFLDDAGTLLGFVHSERLRVTASGPHPDDVDRLVQRLRLPYSNDMPDLNTRLGLLLHLAGRMNWFRREGDTIQLTNNSVRAFLDKTRSEQRRALFDAWRQSPDWNDLCRTPDFECTETGNWKNDPLQTRQTLLRLLGQLQPGIWYTQDDFAAAVKQVEPDFQRPTGGYDSWYIRQNPAPNTAQNNTPNTTQEFLKGFDKWDQVEGALIRFLLRGPLHWLRVIDLADPSVGSNLLFSLSRWGAPWLGHDLPQPEENLHPRISVAEDFTVTVAPDVSLSDRFRVERFAEWQASYPNYVYRITQRALKRAADGGITAARIADFLRTRDRQAPARVIAALEKFSSERVRG